MYFTPISSKIYNKVQNFAATFFNIKHCKFCKKDTSNSNIPRFKTLY